MAEILAHRIREFDVASLSSPTPGVSNLDLDEEFSIGRVTRLNAYSYLICSGRFREISYPLNRVVV
jgi:hypothetical protein